MIMGLRRRIAPITIATPAKRPLGIDPIFWAKGVKVPADWRQRPWLPIWMAMRLLGLESRSSIYRWRDDKRLKMKKVGRGRAGRALVCTADVVAILDDDEVSDQNAALHGAAMAAAGEP